MHVLKEKIEKLEIRFEVCQFLTNAIFLKNDYMNDFKPRSKVLLEELQSNTIRQAPSVRNDIRLITRTTIQS